MSAMKLSRCSASLVTVVALAGGFGASFGRPEDSAARPIDTSDIVRVGSPLRMAVGPYQRLDITFQGVRLMGAPGAFRRRGHVIVQAVRPALGAPVCCVRRVSALMSASCGRACVGR